MNKKITFRHEDKIKIIVENLFWYKDLQMARSMRELWL